MCLKILVSVAKEIALQTGEQLPKGRLHLPAVDEILYELWPRQER